MTFSRRRNIGGLVLNYQGLRFDYATYSHFCQPPDHTPFNFGNNSFSFAFYYYSSSTAIQGLISKRNGLSVDTGYSIFIGGNDLAIRMNNGSDTQHFAGGGNAPINKKLYVVVVIDRVAGGWDYKVYIDNVLRINYNETNMGNFDTSSTFYVSRENLTTPTVPTGLIGFFYNIHVFNKALDATERKYLFDFRGTKTPTTALSNLRALWEFNDGEGMTAIDGSSPAYNLALNNYTVGQTTKGAGNYWVDKNNNPILT